MADRIRKERRNIEEEIPGLAPGLEVPLVRPANELPPGSGVTLRQEKESTLRPAVGLPRPD